ncbi:protein phosphatase 2A B56 regulatory subunit gamma 3-like isoform, partial [Leptotrombidium deliense]
ERLKNKDREEAWHKVESLAVKNPSYNEVREILHISLDTNASYENNTSPMIVDDDVGVNMYDKIEKEAKEAKKAVKKEKPLLRRKSELPQDSLTLKALSDHKRTEDVITTQSDETS